MDQPDMAEIVRHLISEKRRALAMNSSVLDIVFAERFQIIC